MPVVSLNKIVTGESLPLLAASGRTAEFQKLLGSRMWPPEVLFQCLCNAAKAGRLNTTRELLACGVPADRADANGLTPLLAACEYNGTCDEVVLELLARGANIHHSDSFGYQPLHAAVTAGEPQVVRLLLERRAALDHKDREGDTPLDLAQLYSVEPHPRGHDHLRAAVLSLLREAWSRRACMLARWQKVRDAVAVRPAALHWLEEVQRRGLTNLPYGLPTAIHGLL